MRLVLWPRYLLGGALQREGGLGGLERGDLSGGLRGIAGRLPDADVLLQGSMSEGLRDWDLWYAARITPHLSYGVLTYFPQGSPRLLPAAQPPSVLEGGFDQERGGVHWDIWLDLGRVRGRDSADQVAWRHDVRKAPHRVPSGGLTSCRAFFQTICIIGYTLFPLVVAALLSAVGLPIIPRIPIYIVLLLWSLAAGVSILGGSGVVRNRVGLAVYPLFVFYIGLAVLCFIS
jgi:protein YIPF6